MRRIWIVFICFYFLQAGTASGQHGVNPSWYLDTLLPSPSGSNQIRGFLYSNMAAFSNGKRVVFLNKQDMPMKGVYYTSSYDGFNWSNPLPFTPMDAVIGASQPKVIADIHDTLHIIWASQMPKALYHTKMDSAMHVVGFDTVRIAGHPANNIFNDIYLSADRKGRLHVMWNEGDETLDTTESYYARSLDGGDSWSAKDTLSIVDTKSSAFPRGQFSATAGDTLAIGWRDHATTFPDQWDIHMVISADGGSTWSAPMTINQNMNNQGDPDIVIDPYGRIHLFYHEAPMDSAYDGMRVVYGYSDDLGLSWHPSPVFYDNIICRDERSYLVEGSQYDVQNDILWTFWKEEDLPGLKGGDMMCTYSTDRGLSWSQAEYVTDRGDVSIGFKAVALLPNGGVAVNYELPQYPDSGDIRVFYVERNPVSTGIYVPPAEPYNMLLYPNPTSGTVTLTLPGNFNDKDFRVTVFDLYGSPVLNLRNKKSFDTQHLDRGVYFVVLSSAGHQTMSSKLVIY